MKRRDFLKSVGVAGSASLLKPDLIFGSTKQTAAHFNLYPFVDAHPEAVFIKATRVSEKTAIQEKIDAGREFARELFVTSDAGGIPIGSKIAIKPNLTCGGSPTSARMGIYTDGNFVEGLMEGMKELGPRGDQFYLREGNLLGDGYCPDSEVLEWYGPMTERVGAHLTDFDSGRVMADVALENLEEGSEVIWREVPDGVIFKRIGYVAPINAPDAWNLNISKFKAHSMGITLCSKNWQGTNVHPYIHYCSDVPGQFKRYSSSAAKDVQPDYRETLQQLHAQHLEAGVPRWDRPGNIDSWNSGPGMEMWAQKAIDNLSASQIGLHVIEGIYGRNGNFANGPGPDDKAQDFMTNVLIFGLNPIKVDIIGHWLAGHEPGNFGLFHSAKDRGLTNTVNPYEIPIYGWENGQPDRRSLEEFARTPLVTMYLQRDYAGQDEPYWHMADESYDYGPPTAVLAEADAQPNSFVLGHNYPNPFNASTLIEYRLPQAGNARIEIYNSSGQVVDVLVDSWRAGGSHVATWDAGQHASGTYFYRFMTEGFQEARKMLLVR